MSQRSYIADGLGISAADQRVGRIEDSLRDFKQVVSSLEAGVTTEEVNAQIDTKLGVTDNSGRFVLGPGFDETQITLNAESRVLADERPVIVADSGLELGPWTTRHYRVNTTDTTHNSLKGVVGIVQGPTDNNGLGTVLTSNQGKVFEQQLLATRADAVEQLGLSTDVDLFDGLFQPPIPANSVIEVATQPVHLKPGSTITPSGSTLPYLPIDDDFIATRKDIKSFLGDTNTVGQITEHPTETVHLLPGSTIITTGTSNSLPYTIDEEAKIATQKDVENGPKKLPAFCAVNDGQSALANAVVSPDYVGTSAAPITYFNSNRNASISLLLTQTKRKLAFAGLTPNPDTGGWSGDLNPIVSRAGETWLKVEHADASTGASAFFDVNDEILIKSTAVFASGLSKDAPDTSAFSNLAGVDHNGYSKVSKVLRHLDTSNNIHPDFANVQYLQFVLPAGSTWATQINTAYRMRLCHGSENAFDHSHANTNPDYDTSEGTFTAPVDGLFHFDAAIQYNGPQKADGDAGGELNPNRLTGGQTPASNGAANFIWDFQIYSYIAKKGHSIEFRGTNNQNQNGNNQPITRPVHRDEWLLKTGGNVPFRPDPGTLIDHNLSGLVKLNKGDQVGFYHFNTNNENTSSGPCARLAGGLVFFSGYLVSRT